jgi:hypothetical protein
MPEAASLFCRTGHRSTPDKYFGINEGTFHCEGAALMQSIIINGSMVSIMGVAAFGVRGHQSRPEIVRSWSVDRKGRGLRVNVVSPARSSPPATKRNWHERRPD